MQMLKKFYYSSGEEVKVGDIAMVRGGSEWDERFVGLIMQPGSKEAIDSGSPDGGIVIVAKKNNWIVENPASEVLNDGYKLSRRKNDKFYYFNLIEVEFGDIIKVWDGSGWVDGFVEEILLPQSQKADDWGFPKGGVLIKDPHHGRVLEHPDSGVLDADYEFASRGSNSVEGKNENNKGNK